MSTQIGPYTQSDDARLQYDERMSLIADCIALRQPRRMPIGMYLTFWLAKYGNFSFREAMYDHDKLRRVSEEVCLEFQPDTYCPANYFSLGPLWEAIDFKQFTWPGHGVGDDQPFQYLDREWVTAEELDEFLFDPTGFYLSTYLPRIAGFFQHLAPLGSIAGTMDMVPFIPSMLMGPEMESGIQQMRRAAEEGNRLMGYMTDLEQALAAKGYPIGFFLNILAPYDFVADFMRGATQVMKDLYRRGDKLLEVMDKVRVLTMRRLIEATKFTSNTGVFIPIHWAPNQFMSQKHFEKFWWPSFRRMLNDMIAANLTPIVMWESDCSNRLETIADIPKGKCVYWFERTDLVKAHQVLGDVVALRGNLSPSLMNMGTPEQVDAEVKHLVDNIWNKGGCLILDTAFGIPDEAKIENVRAMFAAARKYAG